MYYSGRLRLCFSSYFTDTPNLSGSSVFVFLLYIRHASLAGLLFICNVLIVIVNT